MWLPNGFDPYGHVVFLKSSDNIWERQVSINVSLATKSEMRSCTVRYGCSALNALLLFQTFEYCLNNNILFDHTSMLGFFFLN